MNSTEDRFEDRLLHELRAIVAANPAPASMVSAPAPRLLRRPAALAGAVATLVAGGIATSVILAGGASPAYAVEPQADGSVVVTITTLKDAEGLERKLNAAGVKAVVNYLPEGKMCKRPRYEQTASDGVHGSISGSVDKSGASTFTVGTGQLASDETLVIESSTGGGSPGKAYNSVGLGVAKGAVGPCVVVDAEMPPPGSGNDSGPRLDTGTGPQGGAESQQG